MIKLSAPMGRISLFLLTLGLAVGAAAQHQPLRIQRTAERMRVDGSLREWRAARFSRLPGADIRYALATDDQGLYVAAEVPDPRLVRRPAPGPGQDAVVLSFAMPARGGRWQGTEVWLHPGETGRSAALAGVGPFGGKPKPTTRVRVVEGPLRSGPGYVLEAFVPWDVVRGAQIWQQGRGALRVIDARQPRDRRPSVSATSAARRPAELPTLALGEGQQDLLGSFLAAQGLTGATPRYDLRGDVAGDGRKERVVIVDRYVVVMGPGYQSGQSYGYMRLPVGLGAAVGRARLADVTGDGRAELLVTLRQQNELGARRLWTVIALDGERPRLLWGVETRKQTSDGFVESTLKVRRGRRGQPPLIVVAPGRAQGLDASNFRDQPPAGVAPILVPWGPVERRSYRFQEGRFVVVDERVREAPEAPRAPGAREARAAPSVSAAPTARRAPEPAQLRGLFERELGLSGQRPRWTKRTNLVGSAAPETIYVYGTTAVILGPDVGGGQRYLTYRLPAATAGDVLGMRCADVTGDGTEELLFRVRQPLSGADVVREVLLVLRFAADGRFSRILAVEVARQQGDKRIENQVRLPHGRRRRAGLVIAPGKAQGWSASSYPWAAEAIGGVGRLLLPWQDRPVRYRFRGGALEPG